jgi:hypothetical protein
VTVTEVIHEHHHHDDESDCTQAHENCGHGGD